MSTIQAMFDAWSADWQRQRAETQMTLGELIEALEAMPTDAEVVNLCDPHSYRGYYDDLAFERGEGTRPAAELLRECRIANGSTFTGYKGGEFRMGEQTPVWVAAYGCCGERLMAIGPSAAIATAASD